MAQKDIEDIAIYMRQIDESKNAEQKAFDESCKECDDLQLKEDQEFEDEIIDRTSLGFIDDSNFEDNEEVTSPESPVNPEQLDDDISDCLVQEPTVDESEDQGSITVQVYNEDGFGAHFADEVQKHVPTVSVYTLKHKLPNGDLEVSISGNVEDLKKAYAFYIGKEDFSKVSPEDRDEFNSLLVYSNGDTIAEADYREAVAHCLDPIGVDASTANLVGKDTCAISFIKEEKAKRLFKKMKTCLQENDASVLSDDELEAIDNVTDAIKNDEDYENLSRQNQALMQLIVGEMGYTLDDWNKLTPEAKDKVWKDFEQRTKLNKSGFADTKNQFIVRNPETGEKEITAFNPNYTSDDSTYQHPSAVKRHVRELAALKDQNDKDLKSIEAIKKARGKKDKETWDMQEFYDIISPLDGKERKQLMKDLIADIEKDNADDPKKAGNEIMFIKELFNQKLTLRDFAKAWGATAPGVMKYHDNIIAIWKDTCREFGVDPDLPTGRAKFVKLIANPVTFEKFKTQLRKNLDARKKGRLVKGL